MRRKNNIISYIVAIATIVMFAQCSGKTDNTPSESVAAEEGATTPSTLKIAYVNIDSLLLKYDFWSDVTGEMMKKEENIRVTLTQRSRDLEKDAQDFQRKVDANAFVSQERMQQEYNRISKKQEDLQALSNRLSTEFDNDNNKNSLILRDSINSFIAEYNKTKGYSLILTNTGFDNLLYADPALNITQEIADGLNARYNASGNK